MEGVCTIKIQTTRGHAEVTSSEAYGSSVHQLLGSCRSEAMAVSAA